MGKQKSKGKRRTRTARRQAGRPSFPRRCFVSHSYDDEDQLVALRRAVPAGTKLLTFPRVDQNPDFPVSGEIISKILKCDAVIYLATGKSSVSEWVDFERDYARRVGKPVYSFDSESVSRDDVEPVDLRIQAVFSDKSRKMVNRLLKWMKKERNFIVRDPGEVNRLKEIPLHLLELREQGEIALWLLDSKIAAILDIIHNEDINDDFLAEWCDDPLPPPVPFFYARIDPSWEPPKDPDPEVQAIIDEYPSSHYLDLVHPENERELDWNRVDDLIVALTSLALHQGNLCDEDDDLDS